jgi:Zn-finger nucleic acid-binding protein
MTPFAESALRCGNCLEPMQRITLPSHYGMPVELDLCAACHLVWFDTIESARLSGQSLLTLIGRMAQAQSLPHEVLRKEVRCPRCSLALTAVHNQTRWGHSLQLACLANRHGSYESFAEFLQEKGLLRPMSLPDRHKLLASAGRIDCVNCGAAIGLADEQCPFCRSVASLLDVARLAHALDPEGALAPQAVHQIRPQQAAMQCGACGVALPPGQSLSCAHCGATLAVSRLAEANARVGELAVALKALASKPAPDVVKRRLDALSADLPRRREWVADMQADTQQRSRLDEAFDWGSLLSSGTNPLRAVFIALAIWFFWYFWPRH